MTKLKKQQKNYIFKIRVPTSSSLIRSGENRKVVQSSVKLNDSSEKWGQDANANAKPQHSNLVPML